MKKKITSLVLGIFMCVFSLLTLSGCSLVKKDNTKDNNKVVLTIGDTSLTKSDIINSFYSYYQSNSSYFAYYDEDTIEESFYTWAIIKALIDKKSAEALANGTTVYTVTDEEDVWNSVFEYLYEQVSSKEKDLYPDNAEDEDLPVWLRDEDDEEESSSFSGYVSALAKPETKGEPTIKAGDSLIKNKVGKLEDYLFEYVYDTDDEGNGKRKEIEKEYITKRRDAYASFVNGLLNSAKSNGTSTKIDDLLFNEVKRVYDAYYKSKLSELFQSYYLDDYLLNADTLSLTDKVLVQAFLDQYNTDKEKYQSEQNYISTVTSTDGASLVLYNHNGRNYYFTVQHILVKFDDAISESLSEIEGYSGYEKLDETLGSQIKAQIDAQVYSYFMTTTVNKDAIKDYISVEPYADYYIYDEERASNGTNGYIKVYRKVENEGLENESVTYFEDKNGDDSYNEGTDVLVQEEDVLYLSYITGNGSQITKNQIMDCYDYNYTAWKNLVDSYYDLYKDYQDANEEQKTEKQAAIDTFLNSHKGMEYVFETVNILYEEAKQSANKTAIYRKIADYLFVELEWIFSGDSLGNTLSNKMGYVISNFPDESGSWVYEFPKGARELVEEIVSSGTGSTIDENINNLIASVNNYNTLSKNITKTIISSYGYHIIKVADIFETNSSIIDADAIAKTLTNQKVSANNSEFVSALIKEMKTTFVCGASNQTVYDYFFDKIYTGLVGSSWVNEKSESASSSTSGSYFLKLEYKWLSDYANNGQLEFVNRMTYEELMNSIN